MRKPEKALKRVQLNEKEIAKRDAFYRKS